MQTSPPPLARDSTIVPPDISPIKKRLELDSSIGADQGADAAKDTVSSAVEGGADSHGGAGGVKRTSTETAPSSEASEEKPKKQFKRRNVALYSTLSTDDA